MLRFTLALALMSSPAMAQVASLTATDGQNALGTIPCATGGASLSNCHAELRRRDDGSATLAVALGQGHVRNIYFTDGIPESSNSASKLSYENNGDIMIIFIEPGEVYEIPKAALNTQ